METHQLTNLTQLLQASISPVAMISGVGLLILSQTNRLGRVMDRLRDLLEKRRKLTSPDAHLDQQVAVLHQRARILRTAVTAATFCALLASLLVLLIFLMTLSDAKLDLLAVGLFASSLLSLVLSLIYFLLDMNLSLRAVQQELLR